MVPSFYLGIVTDNADPDKMNRVRVSKEGEEPGVTEWLPVVVPYASDDAGLSFIPDIGDQALVMCLDRSDEHKVVLGTIWFNEALPPETEENTGADLNKDGENTLRFFRSRAGSLMIFDDTEDEEKIQFIASDGKTRLEFCLKDEDVTLTTEHDIKMSSDGKTHFNSEKAEIEIISEKLMTISADSELQVNAEEDIKIEAGKDMKIKGRDISLN